jgi:hypothetical protein
MMVDKIKKLEPYRQHTAYTRLPKIICDMTVEINAPTGSQKYTSIKGILNVAQ